MLAHPYGQRGAAGTACAYSPARDDAEGRSAGPRTDAVRATIAVLAAITVSASLACGPSPAADEAPPPGEWLVLFDGRSVDHWRGFQRDDFPTDGWTIDGDALTPKTDGAVVDIITRRQFRNYELELEWRVAPRGNSGIFVHVTEAHPQVWHTGPEVQVLDDENHPDGRVPETSAGSIYGLVAPGDKALRPAGQYNHSRVVVRGSVIEHVLNGQPVVEIDLDSEDFRSRVAASTFGTLPDFSGAREGHIALQHASVSPLRAPVWFRHVRVRALPDE
jgi:hypothetical protein